MMKRRRFTTDFKARVALDALRGDKTIQEIASKHKVHPNQVSGWKRQAIEGLGAVFSNGGSGGGRGHEAEVRDLHAKTWARTGEPVVRKYQQEYFSRVGVILDTDLPGRDEEKFEAAISLAAGMIANLSRGEALIDLLVTGDRLHPLTVGRSLGHLDQALDHLACVEPGPPFSAAGLMYLAGLSFCDNRNISKVVGFEERRQIQNRPFTIFCLLPALSIQLGP